MNLPERIPFPEEVEKKIVIYLDALTKFGFFDNKEEFPDKESSDIGKIHTWNTLGKNLLNLYLNDPDIDMEHFRFDSDEFEKVLMSVIIQTTLDTLIGDGLVDSIENEDGEHVYWLTDKGKEFRDSID